MSRQQQIVTEAGPAPAAHPLTTADATELAQAFKAVSDPVRLRLLSLIASHAGGEACVSELTTGFERTGPTISHHLKVLRQAGLIEGRRRGTWVYYRVVPRAFARLALTLQTSAAEVS
jgi:ArsR family transcriptional regulator, arsenate/arsenite/antimonite-responsive transcriptional repressor